MPPTVEDEDDTIVVKGEYGSHPSSSESLSSETEPLATNFSSQINQQRLEPPEPYQDTADRSDLRVTSRRPKANATTMEDRLQRLPEVRSLPWRPGVEEGADHETGGESRRKQIRFGCLLASRGEVQEPGCNSCVNGRGKFSLCISLDGYFKGACASCQLSGRPNRCSIKKEDEPISSPAVSTSKGDIASSQAQLATPSSDTHQSGPPRKRRRTSEVKRANEAKLAGSSPKEVPQWIPPHQRLPQPPPYQPAQWGQQPPLPQPQQLSKTPQKTWVTVNQPPPKPQLPSNGTSGYGHLAQEQSRTVLSSTGWATVNQPHLQPQARSPLPPPPQPHGYPPQPHQPQSAPPDQRVMQNGVEGRRNGAYSSAERERRESTAGNEDGSGALIDNLPKAKQRQVYGLVSGLQGGIEHLQRELDALKRAIGIDDEN